MKTKQLPGLTTSERKELNELFGRIDVLTELAKEMQGKNILSVIDIMSEKSNKAIKRLKELNAKY